jgi:hypothetical protein
VTAAAEAVAIVAGFFGLLLLAEWLADLYL